MFHCVHQYERFMNWTSNSLSFTNQIVLLVNSIFCKFNYCIPNTCSTDKMSINSSVVGTVLYRPIKSFKNQGNSPFPPFHLIVSGSWLCRGADLSPLFLVKPISLLLVVFRVARLVLGLELLICRRRARSCSVSISTGGARILYPRANTTKIKKVEYNRYFDLWQHCIRI
jgi:hypothetical protein